MVRKKPNNQKANSIDPDQMGLMCTFFLQSVRIWDLIQCTFDAESPTPLHVIHNAHNDWVTDLKWSNTADFLVTSSNDFTLKGM
jgi:WD40 repeat protein